MRVNDDKMRVNDRDNFATLDLNYDSYPRHNIYELTENNGTMQWDYLSNFKWMENKLAFPEIISPMKNGKFIFYSQFYDRDYEGLDYIMEVRDIYQNFTQSRLEFPMNLFPLNIRIFQL